MNKDSRDARLLNQLFKKYALPYHLTTIKERNGTFGYFISYVIDEIQPDGSVIRVSWGLYPAVAFSRLLENYNGPYFDKLNIVYERWINQIRPH